VEVGEIRVGGRACREETEGEPGDGGFGGRPNPFGVLLLTRKGSSRSLRGGRLPPYSFGRHEGVKYSSSSFFEGKNIVLFTCGLDHSFVVTEE